MKKILGLDLGTNSIGWAITQLDFENKQGNIEGLGSRIIPMDQKQLTDFESGNSISATADRTKYRGTRRLYQRDNLRRERLHRVLNVLEFLPEHYKKAIDFEKRKGQFKYEVKLNYRKTDKGKYEFLFMDSFGEMTKDFNKQEIPYDWTLYYLRKKALTQKISKEELAWIILNFNQKRGYYQLREEKKIETKGNKEIENFDEKIIKISTISPNKYKITLSDNTTYIEESSIQLSFVGDLREVEITRELKKDKKNKDEVLVESKKVKYLTTLKVVEVADTKETVKRNKNTNKKYKVVLENGFEFIKEKNENNKLNWKGKNKTVLVSYDIKENGKSNIKISAPKEDDWGLIKKKTEQDLDKYIEQSNKHTVGTYIYEHLLQKPDTKIRGKLIKTIERKYYKQELEKIFDEQVKHHPELQNKDLHQQALNELYTHNEAHKSNIKDKDFKHLFVEDIIFYQRPLKSQKSNISGCQYETRSYWRAVTDSKTGETKKELVEEPLKAIPKSHPIYQEFRLWQWLKNLRIYKKYEDDRFVDKDVTNELLKTEEDWTNLFDFLNEKKEIKQNTVIGYFFKKKAEKENHRWNYVEDKTYPMNETRAQILSRLKKVSGINPQEFLDKDKEQHLWHIIYSVKDTEQFKKALKKFAKRYNLQVDEFVNAFEKHSPYKSDYGAYSEKAIKKLLPLMRTGKYWDENAIPEEVKQRIDTIMERVNALKLPENPTDKQVKEAFEKYDVTDDDIQQQLIKSFIPFTGKNPYKHLNTYQAGYAVYNRYSEIGETKPWRKPEDIDKFLKEFKQHSLRNPIVEQVITETLRTVRDIWKEYGNFDEIHLEIGRELKKPADERKRLTQQITENQNTNERIRLLLQELMNDGAKPHSPSHQEILKIYEEGVYQNPGVKYNEVKEDEIEKIRKNNSPTPNDIKKYKLWLEQGYVSPYTGKTIPLSRLFSVDYEIEHIIPQSRYFDDSMSNKVICESEVNRLKSNQTAYEFIKNNGGEKVNLGQGKSVEILKWEAYESHCNKYFKNNKAKLKKLLSEEIPEGFINRQLNDSRYIAKYIKSLLGKIVRQEGEKEGTPKNLIVLTGAITSKLKQDWGLNDKWNELILPRFKRLNKLTDRNDFTYINENGVEVPTVPDELKKGFNKKRIDHRHHALDALIIAVCTRKHIQYINSLNNKKEKYNLQPSLMVKNKEGDYTKYFALPWETFPVDALNSLETTIVSFKQNLRVINRTNNKYWKYVKQKDGSYKKQLVKQEGENFAIRKSLHTPLPYGKKEYTFTVLEIAKNVGKREEIVDNWIREEVEKLLREKGTIGKTEKYLKKNPLTDEYGQEIKSCIFKNPQIRYRKRKPITVLANRGQGGIKKPEDAIKLINKVSDLGIRNDLLQHFKENNYELDKAFSIEGIEEFNSKRKIPVYRLPIAEYSTKKFQLGEKNENAKVKYGEADGDSNLYFAIYINEKGEREYETVPLNEVIAHQKQQAEEVIPLKKQTPIPVNAKKGDLLFTLSPGDLVYVPTDEEMDNPNLVDFDKLCKEQVDRIYKMVSTTKNECHFIPYNNASEIRKNENGTNSKSERIQDFYNEKCFYDRSNKPVMIKSRCWKLKVDRLGNLQLIR